MISEKRNNIQSAIPDHLKNQPPVKFYRRDLIGGRWDGYKIDPAQFVDAWDATDAETPALERKVKLYRARFTRQD